MARKFELFCGCLGNDTTVCNKAVTEKMEYTITQRERNRISGRFMKVSENPLVVGLLGSLHARDLTPAQMAHIKAYYNASGKDHEIKKEFPVKINRSMYNDFIIIK